MFLQGPYFSTKGALRLPKAKSWWEHFMPELRKLIFCIWIKRPQSVQPVNSFDVRFSSSSPDNEQKMTWLQSSSSKILACLTGTKWPSHSHVFWRFCSRSSSFPNDPETKEKQKNCLNYLLLKRKDVLGLLLPGLEKAWFTNFLK